MTTLEKIISLIDSNGITKNKLLAELGLNRNSFVNWEKRGTSPSGETLSKIAAYFNVTTDYLLGNDINKANDPATNDQLKFALFGDTNVSDELLEEVKEIAKLQRKLREKR